MSTAWSFAVDLLDLVRGLSVSLGIVAASVTLLRSRPEHGQVWAWLERSLVVGLLVTSGAALGFGGCLYGQLNGYTASPSPTIPVVSPECERVKVDYANLLDSLGDELPKMAKR